MTKATVEQDRDSEQRSRLLTLTVDYLEQHGFAGFSLRPLAAAIGTSPRMLVYWFGSKDGLIRMIAEEVQRRESEWLSSPAAVSTAPGDLLEIALRRAIDPKKRNLQRLVLEMLVAALNDPKSHRELLDLLVYGLLEPIYSIEMRYESDPERARSRARLALAAVRGLQVDVLVTGDVRAAEDAIRELRCLIEEAKANR
ncbi:MAG: TetR/AcrR family transcriptional regulator [Chloroflexi bacterium]|nr:TetR/AcrR family transcriptional regulator [Chloroflexota bacterium]MDQ3499925.1 TetR/AcrR family transcriptional regulator [Actinomycetota bacterium]